jgi:hypothetical protein
MHISCGQAIKIMLSSFRNVWPARSRERVGAGTNGEGLFSDGAGGSVDTRFAAVTASARAIEGQQDRADRDRLEVARESRGARREGPAMPRSASRARAGQGWASHYSEFSRCGSSSRAIHLFNTGQCENPPGELVTSPRCGTARMRQVTHSPSGAAHCDTVG